jgi:ketol-acid reductoisomerase
MSGVISPLHQYAFMTWCSVKNTGMMMIVMHLCLLIASLKVRSHLKENILHAFFSVFFMLFQCERIQRSVTTALVAKKCLGHMYIAV